jgi:hypothetical protein
MEAASPKEEPGKKPVKKNLIMNTNKISIKIIGESSRVLKSLEKIESVFPLSVRSKICPNDDGENVHCWLTVALEA